MCPMVLCMWWGVETKTASESQDSNPKYFHPHCESHLLLLSSPSVVSDSCNPMDYSPPGSSVHRISQVSVLEWVAVSSSRRASPPRDQIRVSCIGRRVLYHLGSPGVLVLDIFTYTKLTYILSPATSSHLLLLRGQ